MILLLCNCYFFLQDFLVGQTITLKKSFSGHHALPISMQDIDWTPSEHRWCFLSHGGSPVVTMVVSILKWSSMDALGVTPIVGNHHITSLTSGNMYSWRWRTLRMDTLQDRKPGPQITYLRVEMVHIKLTGIRTWMKFDRNFRDFFWENRFPDHFGSKLEDSGGALERTNEIKWIWITFPLVCNS